MNKLSLLKEELQKLGKSLSTVFNELPAEPTKEGELHISAVEIGGKVEMIDAGGALQPVEDGDYMHGEDVLTVQGGQIVAINGDKGEDKPADEPKQEMADEETEESTETEEPAHEEPKANEDMEAMKAEVDALKQSIADMQAQMAEYLSKADDTASQFTAQVKELNETIKTLASIPVEFSKTNENNKVKDAKDDKLTAALSIYGKRK